MLLKYLSTLFHFHAFIWKWGKFLNSPLHFICQKFASYMDGCNLLSVHLTMSCPCKPSFRSKPSPLEIKLKRLCLNQRSSSMVRQWAYNPLCPQLVGPILTVYLPCWFPLQGPLGGSLRSLSQMFQLKILLSRCQEPSLSI